MAINTQSKVRQTYMEKVRQWLAADGEEILATATNELTLPCVDEKGEEMFLTLVFKIPKGSRDGDPYDGYEMAQDYERCQAEKAKNRATAKAKKEADFAKQELIKKKKAEKKEKRKETEGEN